VPLSKPIAIRSVHDGGAWVLRSRLERSGAPSRLDRIRADGERTVGLELGPCVALAVTDAGDALVIETNANAGGADRLLRCDAGGGKSILLERPGLVCVVESARGSLVGTVAGEILRVADAPGSSVVELGRTTAPVVDLASDRTTGGVYALSGEGGSELGRLDAELVTQWSSRTGMRCVRVASTEDGAHVWIAGVDRPVARRWGRDGTLELERSDLSLAGFHSVVAASDGGAILAAAGGMLRLDSQGRDRPGQGGFDWIADLDRAPAVRRRDSPP